MSTLQKIFYVEDQLTQNIPRLIRLFKDYLNDAEVKQLEQLEHDSSGYGADPEKIKQVFKDIPCITLEYRFPEALAEIRKYADQYTLFIVDRNLADSQYTFEDVQKVDPQFSQNFHDRFHEREGDYILLKLALTKKIDILNTFYFLTAYPAHYELQSASEVGDLIDLGAFQQKNFIEKGNTANVDHLYEIIKKSALHTSSMTGLYLFQLEDGSSFKGTFVSPLVKVQTGNGKTPLETSQISDVTRVGKVPNPEFIFELKTGDSIQGRFVDKKITINTQISPKHKIVTQNIQSIKIV